MDQKALGLTFECLNGQIFEAYINLEDDEELLVSQAFYAFEYLPRLHLSQSSERLESYLF